MAHMFVLDRIFPFWVLAQIYLRYISTTSETTLITIVTTTINAVTFYSKTKKKKHRVYGFSIVFNNHIKPTSVTYFRNAKKMLSTKIKKYSTI